MSTTHADNLKSSWFKQKYYIEGGYLKPAPGQTPIRYNPMSLYKPSTADQRVTDSLHHLFANIDLSNESEIEEFYSKYGPLGLFENDITNVVAFNPSLPHLYPMPDESPIAGVGRDTNELIPMSDLQSRYHIPLDKLPIPSKDDIVLPSTNLSSADTWESLGDFRKESLRFREIINLRNALAKGNTEEIRSILAQDQHYSSLKKVTKCSDKEQLLTTFSDKELLLFATGQVLWHVNGAMENRVYPVLTYDNVGHGISKSITWRCDSLFSSLYTMIFLDISRGALMKRCKKCNRFFESMRPNTEYCTTSCQTSAKSQRSRKPKK